MRASTGSPETRGVDVAVQIREQFLKDLRDNQFLLYYQSIIALQAEGKPTLYREMLVRFREEEQGLMPPGTFIPTLEAHGLMPLLDRWVVATVLRWVRTTQAAVASKIVPRCSVNLADDTIRDPAFPDYVQQAARKIEGPAESLSFEIPIGHAREDPDMVARLVYPLRRIGCSFALSGFTGSDGLELAQALGITFIKIDGSLVDRVARDPKSAQELRAIHERAATLGMRTVGMQVESNATLDALRQMQVNYAQGFGIDKPRMLK
jgi:EAL domain-containing protein (putative c-di-GMP-specific phosphodiesterase class I)